MDPQSERIIEGDPHPFPRVEYRSFAALGQISASLARSESRNWSRVPLTITHRRVPFLVARNMFALSKQSSFSGRGWPSLRFFHRRFPGGPRSARLCASLACPSAQARPAPWVAQDAAQSVLQPQLSPTLPTNRPLVMTGSTASRLNDSGRTHALPSAKKHSMGDHRYEGGSGLPGNRRAEWQRRVKTCRSRMHRMRQQCSVACAVRNVRETVGSRRKQLTRTNGRFQAQQPAPGTTRMGAKPLSALDRQKVSYGSIQTSDGLTSSTNHPIQSDALFSAPSVPVQVIFLVSKCQKR